MSRIGKLAVPVPSGVSIEIKGTNSIQIQGPKGVLSRVLPGDISVRQDNDTLVVQRPNDERKSKALHGLSRTLVANMVTGVTAGFVKELEIRGVGYRAVPKGPQELELFLGFSHTVQMLAPAGVSFEVPLPTRILVHGIDKEVVGQVAANIRKVRKPEPYKGKGVRYLGEKVLLKAGKTGK